MQLPDTQLPGSTSRAQEGRAVFVYYRLRPSRVSALRQAFERGMSKPAEWEARLMRKVEKVEQAARVDAAGDGGDGERLDEDARLQTWMEIYSLRNEAPLANDALQESIERCARAAGIVDLVDGVRHYEIFEPCA